MANVQHIQFIQLMMILIMSVGVGWKAKHTTKKKYTQKSPLRNIHTIFPIIFLRSLLVTGFTFIHFHVFFAAFHERQKMCMKTLSPLTVPPPLLPNEYLLLYQKLLNFSLFFCVLRNFVDGKITKKIREENSKLIQFHKFLFLLFDFSRILHRN